MTQLLFDAPGPRARRRMLVANIVAAVVLLAIAAVFVKALADKDQLTAARWSPFATADVWQYYLLPGLRGTLVAAGISIVTSLVFGLLFGLGRVSPVAPVRWFCGVVVEFFRAVPVLLMMVFGWLFLGQLQILPVDQLPLVAVVAGLTLYNGSVVAELIRSGVYGLPRGQREAGLAVGLTEGSTLWSVLLPQALVAMLPALISQLVVILKDSALGYLITYVELLRQGRQIGTTYQNLIPALIVVAVIFILLNVLLGALAQKLAGRLRGRTAGAVRAGAPGGAVGTAGTVGTTGAAPR
ncbi:amino acid ABC transporter permease [Cellulomonas sp. RIT-PI-Y]|uniref:amino acid ABC transporter permease n=1 Tax=Cellulomonas sp. RIT-PI-Y TaxID=3035297 RepID=UPI0021D93E86|nr:amino acid ABC transporter permease [Cellulomonas sp. RIT-PI-Y]